MGFETCIARVLGNEGGYVNDPADPGGETQWGISKRAYPMLDIKSLSRNSAIAIYRRDFWERISADKLPPLLQFQVLDFAVNCGIETAVRKVQSAVGVADDGHFGPVSLAAVAAMSAVALTFKFLAEELDYRRKLSGWPRYGAGWTARVANDMRFAATDYTTGVTA
jgi:lysozyme family protein